MKGLGLLANWIGTALLLLLCLGAFKHPDRIKLYDALIDKREFPARGSKPAKHLMKNFGLPDQQIEMIDKIVLHDLRFGRTGPPIAGNVEAWTSDDKRRTVGSLIDVKDWAYAESERHRWISFAFILIALLANTWSWLKERCWARALTTPRTTVNTCSGNSGDMEIPLVVGIAHTPTVPRTTASVHLRRESADL
jgi:hypothetical protein